MPIMYVCEPCGEHAPESCGHYKREEIAIMPDGTWVCDDCYDNAGPDEFGLTGNFDEFRPPFYDMPHPPIYGPPALGAGIGGSLFDQMSDDEKARATP